MSSNVSSVLVVLAHPNLGESRANAAMARAVGDLEQVTVVDLYDEVGASPTPNTANIIFDVGAEQARLEAHDVVVLQHPLHWYSSPSLLKEWLDQILQPGWAYFGDNMLAGKQLRSAVTAGAPESAYGEGGWNPYPLDDYLRVFESTGHFCKMEWGEPYVMYTASELPEADFVAEVDRYRAWIAKLAGLTDV